VRRVGGWAMRVAGGGGGLGGSLELGVAVTLGRFLACPQESSPYRKSSLNQLKALIVHSSHANQCLKTHQQAAES